jgi:hypothetical protein
MRLTIIITCLLLLLLASACASAAQPPWAATDRELIREMAEGGKYYFIRSSFQLCDEGIIVDTVMEYDQKADDPTAKYILETVRIIPSVNRIKVISSKGYNAKGILLFDHPPEEWQTPNSLIHGGLVPAVTEYWLKNLTRFEPKPSSVSDTSWYIKVHTTSSGDSYYFHPGRIIADGDSISVSIRIDYRQERLGVKFSLQDIKIDPANRRYYVGSISIFDANGKIIGFYLAEASPVWRSIEPGTGKEVFIAHILEYCRKSYITLKAPFREAFPRLIPYIPGNSHYFFNPDSIVVREGYLWVEAIHDSGSGAYASLEVLRLNDRKTTVAGSHSYDESGQEIHRNNTGIQWWNWGEIKPGSIQETLFAAVLVFCRENNIPLEE